MIIATIFRVLGPTILRTFLRGNNGGGGGGGDDTSVTGVSPFEDDEDADDFPPIDSNGSGVSFSLPDNEEGTEVSNVPSSTSTTTIESRGDITTSNVKTALDNIRATTVSSETENEVTTKL